MSEFKIGSRVRVKCSDDIYPGFIGKIIDDDDEYSWVVLFNNGQQSWCDDYELEHVAPSLETMIIGDIVVNDIGNEAKVLEVGVNSFLRSYWDGFNKAADSWHTFAEAKKLGWKVKGQVEEKPEFTFAEICERLGVKDFIIIK